MAPEECRLRIADAAAQDFGRDRGSALPTLTVATAPCHVLLARDAGEATVPRHLSVQQTRGFDPLLKVRQGERTEISTRSWDWGCYKSQPANMLEVHRSMGVRYGQTRRGRSEGITSLVGLTKRVVQTLG